MTKRELRKLLEDVPEEAQIVVADWPKVNNWVCHILPQIGKIPREQMFVLGLSVRDAHKEEPNIKWLSRR